jgi:hypothetical protein
VALAGEKGGPWQEASSSELNVEDLEKFEEMLVGGSGRMRGGEGQDGRSLVSKAGISDCICS